MGGAFAVWLDEDDWRPWLGKQDQVYIPEGTGQHSSQCQLFTVNRPYLIHDAVDFIKDGEEVASAAGWDVDAMVESINEAAPKNPAKDDNTSSDARSFEDVVREGTQGQSYETGAKVVDTTHVLVTEPDTGKVTQYILDRRGQKKTLFLKEDRYDKMEDCFRGDTLVLTQAGHRPIRELSGEMHSVLCGDGAWREARFGSGGNQELFKITLPSGETIYSTARHRWFTGWKMEEKTTVELAGLNLPIIPSFQRPDRKDAEFLSGVQHGIVFGDGGRVSKNTFRVQLYCEKKQLSIFFDKISTGYRARLSDPNFLIARISSPGVDLKKPPNILKSDTYWYGFFCGLISTDGCVSEQHGTVTLQQSDPDSIRLIASQCYRFGISVSSIRDFTTTDSSYKSKQDVSVITFVKQSLVLEDFLRERHRRNFISNVKRDRLATVKVASVEPTGITEEVFCCREPETSSFVLSSGILTGNCITFFTLQPGNGKFYGSKGLGRILGNMALSQERTRNEIVDQFQLAGLIILKTGVAQAPQLQLKIKTPLMVVSTDGDFIKQPINVDVEKFLALDAYMSRLAEMAAGAYIPDKITTAGDPTAKTATEATIDASRENEAKIAFLARAWGQIANMISTIQRRLCKKGTSDEVAKQLQKDLKDGGFTDEEIQEIANVPAAEVVQDLSTVQGQQIQQVAAKYRGDPSIDQQKLMRYDITAMSTPQLADDIIIPQNDHTIEVEEVRQQLQENEDMSSGASMPVSPRDKHDIHLKVLLSEIQRTAPQIVQKVSSDPNNAPMLDNVNAALIHGQAHVDMMKQQGMKPEQLKPYQDAIDMADKMLQEFAKKLAEQAQQAPQMPADASQAPVDPNAPSADPNAPQQIHPEEHMLKITSSIKYEDAPSSIQAQIEAAAGFIPASAEERKQSGATEAVQKHPDLPAKLQEVHPSEVISPQPVDPSQVITPQEIDPSSVIK